MRSLSTAVVFAVVVSIVPAQAIWTPATGQSLAGTFAAAAPGDIVVLSYWHPPFTLNKGLVLLGPGDIQDVGGVGMTVSSFSIPAGQQARVLNVDFKSSSGINGPLGHRVAVNGDVSFESCLFGVGLPESLAVMSGTVVMRNCTVRGGTSNPWGVQGGMRLAGGICAMTDCTLHGSPAQFTGYGNVIASTPALNHMGGILAASHVTAFGGGASNDSCGWVIPASPAFVSSGTVYLTDSSLHGGSGMVMWGNPGPGATALAGNANVHVARTTLSGGAGTIQGAGSTGGVQTVPQMVGIRVNNGLVLGQTSTVTAIAGSSQQALGIGGGFSAVPSTVPIIVEPAFGQQVIPLTLAMPAPGAAVNAAVVVPNNPALRGTGVWFQAFQLDVPVVRASSLVGGAIH